MPLECCFNNVNELGSMRNGSRTHSYGRLIGEKNAQMTFIFWPNPVGDRDAPVPVMTGGLVPVMTGHPVGLGTQSDWDPVMTGTQS